MRFLLYPLLFFVPFMTSKQNFTAIACTATVSICFIIIYVDAFIHQRGWLGVHVAVIAALGLVSSEFNYGWAFFLICALIVAGKMRPLRHGLISMALVEGALIALGVSLHTQPIYLVMYAFIGGLSGAAAMVQWERERQNNDLATAHRELRALAVISERERISRDLHDLLGHTLTLVAVKAELAARLVGHNDERAQREMREVAEAAREALGEVHSVVAGIRGASIKMEIEQATRMLKAAAVRPDIVADTIPLDPQHEAVLAMVIREAVTNVIRHAAATRCEIRMTTENPNQLKLQISDDGGGGGGPLCEGAGLGGMRARIAAVGGMLNVKSGSQGTRLIICIPLGTST
jgi:two-component system sensor histidine kinase DesK